VDRDARVVGARRRDERRDLAAGVVAVGEQQDHGRRAAALLPVSLQRPERGHHAVAEQRPRRRVGRCERLRHDLPVRRRERQHPGGLAERDGADAEALGQCVEDASDRGARRREPRGRHVRRVHRPRGVERDHHRRALARDLQDGLGPSRRDRQRDERQQQQERGDVAARAGRVRRDHRDQDRVRERGRRAEAAPLGKDVHEQKDRDREQPEEHEREIEAHRSTVRADRRNARPRSLRPPSARAAIRFRTRKAADRPSRP
jgi:hypothetical protein